MKNSSAHEEVGEKSNVYVFERSNADVGFIILFRVRWHEFSEFIRLVIFFSVFNTIT